MEPANPFKNNPFNLLRATSQDAVALQASAAYEHQAVLRTLKLTGLEPYRRDLLRAAAQHFGEARLTFLQFHAAFPDFPLRLACNNMKHLPKPLHLLQEAIFPVWLKAFSQLPIIKPYEAFFDSVEIEEQGHRPIGLIFYRRGFPDGLILHNGDPFKFVPPRAGCVLYRGAGGKKAMNLVVQRYSGLLQQLYAAGHGWKPITVLL